MSKRTRIIVLLICIVLSSILVYASIFLPLKTIDYGTKEQVVTTLTGNKLVIVYPRKLYYDKERNQNSTISIVLEPPSFPKQSIVDFSNKDCTKLLKPTAPLVPSSQSAPDSEIFYLLRLDDSINIFDDQGHTVQDLYLVTNDEHKHELIFLVSSHPNLWTSKPACLVITGESLSDQIVIQIELQAKILSYLNTIFLALASVLGGIFLAVTVKIIEIYFKNLNDDNRDLQGKLRILLKQKEWDEAFKISSKNWKKYETAIIKIWHEEIEVHKSDLQEEIKNIKNFLVAFKAKQPLTENNIKVINEIFRYDDLGNTFILEEACNYINDSEDSPDYLKRLASTYENRNLELIIKALKVQSFDNHDFFRNNLILENKFLKIRCECDYINSIAEFEKIWPEGFEFFQPLYQDDEIKELTKVYSVESKSLGGKTVLGIWLLKKMLVYAKSTKNKKSFPIYVPVSGMSAQDHLLDMIELHLSHQLIRYIALNPGEFMNKNLPDLQKRNIKALIDVKLSSFIASLESIGSTPELKSRYSEIQDLINHVKTLKNLNWPKRPKDRIEKYGNCLPANKFSGVLFILDYSMAENAKLDQLLNLCNLALQYDGLRVVVLIPEIFRDGLAKLESKNIQLTYEREKLKKILNNRLRTDAKQYLSDVKNSIAKVIGNVDPRPYELLDSDRFVVASQGLPGKLFQKGHDFLQRVGERQGKVNSADVFGIFYVPDELMGSKASIAQSHQESSLISNEKMFMIANALDQIEAGWSTDWKSMADAYYVINGNKIKLVLYENSSLMVRDQRKERIVRIKKRIEERILGLDNITVNLVYPWHPENGLLFECCPNPLGDQISIVYFDKYLRYLIIMEAFNKSDSDKLFPQIRDFYDGD